MHKCDLQQLKIAPRLCNRGSFLCCVPNLGEINWELLLLKEAPLPPFNHIILQFRHLCRE